MRRDIHLSPSHDSLHNGDLPQRAIPFRIFMHTSASRADKRSLMLTVFAGALLLALGSLGSEPAIAQSSGYPARPIRLVVPFTPGGSSDILSRAIGQKLSEAWGQPVVIENVPGAAGAIGAEKVSKAVPDGYTLLMGHIGTLAVNPSLYPNLPYDPIKNFSPVALVARVPNVLVVHPSVAAKNVKELVALAKAKPGQLNYGSGGNGSAANLATEYFKLQTGTSMVHIPYRGTAPAVTDLLAGQIQLVFTGAPAVMAQVKAGQLRALAVSSPTRLEALPDLPTVAESGYKEFEADQWYGVVAPAGTPPEIVSKLNAQINLALASPELRNRLNSEGAIATPDTAAAFGKLIAREITRWRPVIQSGRVKAD
jgi:tripartite-type tricarboxylate transporter receptor subunit TctC